MSETPGDNSARFGRGMMMVAWVLGLAALAMVFTGALERQDNPNANPVSVRDGGSVEVRLQRNRQGHYVATGQINDRPVEFLIDTGASLVSIPGALARELELPRGPELRFDTANGVATGYLTRLRTVALGDIVVHDIEAGVAEGFDSDQVLLGMNFLRSLDLLQSGDVMVLRLVGEV